MRVALLPTVYRVQESAFTTVDESIRFTKEHT